MRKIHILTVGKTKESWLQDAIDEYLKRLPNVEFTLTKSEKALYSSIQNEKYPILLDSEGKEMDSLAFSEFLQSQSQMTFVIGGPDGFPKELKERYPTISLSKLTFTHQLARLILLEQIYRAIEIEKGSPYHRFRK